MTSHSKFFEEAGQIVKEIDMQSVDLVVALLTATRRAGGRLFILGV
jgi:hypothetical protein